MGSRRTRKEERDELTAARRTWAIQKIGADLINSAVVDSEYPGVETPDVNALCGTDESVP